MNKHKNQPCRHQKCLEFCMFARCRKAWVLLVAARLEFCSLPQGLSFACCRKAWVLQFLLWNFFFMFSRLIRFRMSNPERAPVALLLCYFSVFFSLSFCLSPSFSLTFSGPDQPACFLVWSLFCCTLYPVVSQLWVSCSWSSCSWSTCTLWSQI